jgi:hypothetical protein
MVIRILTEHDAEEFMRLRLEALTASRMPLHARWRMGPPRGLPRA